MLAPVMDESHKKLPTNRPHLVRDLSVNLSSPRIHYQELEGTITNHVPELIEAIDNRERHNFRIGCFLLVVAIATWLTGLELVNTVMKGDEYQKPCFLAYLTGLCFMLNFVPEIIHFFTHLAGLESLPDQLRLEKDANEPIPLTRLEVHTLALQMMVIYFAYNTCVMNALQYTSASNQTVLGSLTTMFTLFIGVWMGVDYLSFKKMICVISSLVGVILISFSERRLDPGEVGRFQPKNPLFGNFLALLGALCYALYLIVMKVRCGTGRTTDERLLFGYVGVYTFLLGIPVLMAFHISGFETFSLPPSWTIFSMVLINSVFSVISDFVTILAMLLTSPLITSLALTSSIPITILLDYIIMQVTGESKGGTSNLKMYIFGVSCVLMAVILINVNLTSEEEFIEQVIDETLDEAMRENQMLSPLLSPFLSSHHEFGNPVLEFKKSKSQMEVPNFNLVTGGDEQPLMNTNHDTKLYTLNDEIGEGSSQDVHPRQLVVSGGLNHRYRVDFADEETHDV